MKNYIKDRSSVNKAAALDELHKIATFPKQQSDQYSPLEEPVELSGSVGLTLEDIQRLQKSISLPPYSNRQGKRFARRLGDHFSQAKLETEADKKIILELLQEFLARRTAADRIGSLAAIFINYSFALGMAAETGFSVVQLMDSENKYKGSNPILFPDAKFAAIIGFTTFLQILSYKSNLTFRAPIESSIHGLIDQLFGRDEDDRRSKFRQFLGLASSSLIILAALFASAVNTAPVITSVDRGSEDFPTLDSYFLFGQNKYLTNSINACLTIGHMVGLFVVYNGSIKTFADGPIKNRHKLVSSNPLYSRNQELFSLDSKEYDKRAYLIAAISLIFISITNIAGRAFFNGRRINEIAENIELPLPKELGNILGMVNGFTTQPFAINNALRFAASLVIFTQLIKAGNVNSGIILDQLTATLSAFSLCFLISPGLEKLNKAIDEKLVSNIGQTGAKAIEYTTSLSVLVGAVLYNLAGTLSNLLGEAQKKQEKKSVEIKEQASKSGQDQSISSRQIIEARIVGPTQGRDNSRVHHLDIEGGEPQRPSQTPKTTISSISPRASILKPVIMTPSRAQKVACAIM